MLEENKSILDKPEVLRTETAIKPEPVKKGKAWIVKLILVLLIAGLTIYLFMHPEIIRNPVDKFLGTFS